MMVLFTLLLAAQTPAADPPPVIQPDITVTAREEKRRLSSVIRSIVRGANDRQFARFETGVCPVVAGASPALSTAMLAMVRENMTQVGAPVAPEGCRINALIAFSDEPGGVVELIFKRRFGMSRWLSRTRRDRLVKGADPIRSWQLSQVNSAMGIAVQGDVLRPPETRNPLATRLKPPDRHDAYFAIAVIDTEHAPGKTVRQLADVATMHLLLNVVPDAADSPEETILSLFARDTPPSEMTTFDRGILKGLYQPQNNAAHGWVQRGRMAAAVRGERDEKERDEEPAAD